MNTCTPILYQYGILPLPCDFCNLCYHLGIMACSSELCSTLPLRQYSRPEAWVMGQRYNSLLFFTSMLPIWFVAGNLGQMYDRNGWDWLDSLGNNFNKVVRLTGLYGVSHSRRWHLTIINDGAITLYGRIAYYMCSIRLHFTISLSRMRRSSMTTLNGLSS